MDFWAIILSSLRLVLHWLLKYFWFFLLFKGLKIRVLTKR